mgnify:CR=1 FL=1
MPTTRTLFPVMLGGGGPQGNYAVNLNMSMDSSYVISAQLVDQNGNALGNERTIDLPLESVVVNGSYDSQTESIILTLQNGNTITIPVSGLVSGLREVIEVTDMTQSQLADFYTNYSTLMETNTYVVNGYSFNTLRREGDVIVLVLQYGAYNLDNHAFWLNEFIIYSDGTTTTDTFQLNISTVARTGSYSDLTDKPILGTMASESASDYTPTSGLATVATTGSYPDLHNRPTIPTVNDATITLQDDGGTTIDSFTLNQSSNKTITIPSGGGGSQWFGTQTQFDNLGTYDDDTDYFISDKIDYNTDIKHKPDLTVYATKTEVNTKNASQDAEIAGKLSGVFMTQQEFDALGNNVHEGQNYFIEGSTIQMVVTFTDQSTATYNVVVD